MALIGLAVSEEKTFENNSHIHVYVYSPGLGSDNLLGSNFFININHLSIQSFAASFPIK